MGSDFRVASQQPPRPDDPSRSHPRFADHRAMADHRRFCDDLWFHDDERAWPQEVRVIPLPDLDTIGMLLHSAINLIHQSISHSPFNKGAVRPENQVVGHDSRIALPASVGRVRSTPGQGDHTSPRVLDGAPPIGPRDLQHGPDVAD